ncbi:hypothetical protein D5086_020409 [Populus alba]|uniref:Uncharacterized protein n=1 Tax=Populus alba TaxID=43335 RepID=A0ACC4BKL5_POPAL
MFIVAPQDSYALCRVFKKTIHISKKKEEKNNGTEEKDAAWVSEEQLLGDDTSGIPSSKGREAEDENFNNDYCKFPSETSSSDVTQGTPIETAIADDLQAPFPSDEANSSASLYSMGVDFSSNLIQVSGARFVWMGTEAAGRDPWAEARRTASAFKPMGTVWAGSSKLINGLFDQGPVGNFGTTIITG